MEPLIAAGLIMAAILLSVRAWTLMRVFEDSLDELLYLSTQTRELNEAQLKMLDNAEKFYNK